MFKSSEEENNTSFDGGFNNKSFEDTVIGKSIKIEGDIKSSGDIVIDGEVIGSLQTENNIKIGETAKIRADINAKELVIAGDVQGNVNASEKTELQSTARLKGDIRAKTVIIAAGAVFNGKCEMGEAEQSSTAQANEAIVQTENEGPLESENQEEEFAQD